MINSIELNSDFQYLHPLLMQEPLLILWLKRVALSIWHVMPGGHPGPKSCGNERMVIWYDTTKVQFQLLMEILWFLPQHLGKVEKILKGSLDLIPPPSPSVKIQLIAGIFAWGVKAKHWWALSTNFWKQKVCWHHPAMFCLISSSKHSRT